MAFKKAFDDLTKEDTVLNSDTDGLSNQKLVQEYKDRMGYIDEAMLAMKDYSDFRPPTKTRLRTRGNKAKNILRKEISKLENEMKAAEEAEKQRLLIKAKKAEKAKKKRDRKKARKKEKKKATAATKMAAVVRGRQARTLRKRMEQSNTLQGLMKKGENIPADEYLPYFDESGQLTERQQKLAATFGKVGGRKTRRRRKKKGKRNTKRRRKTKRKRNKKKRKTKRR